MTIGMVLDFPYRTRPVMSAGPPAGWPDLYQIGRPHQWMSDWKIYRISSNMNVIYSFTKSTKNTMCRRSVRTVIL